MTEDLKSLSQPDLTRCYITDSAGGHHPHVGVEVESVIDSGIHVVTVYKVFWMYNPENPQEQFKFRKLKATYANPISVEIS